MSTSLTIIVAFLAVIFVISGLSKASGNEKGLSGTRDVNVPDKLARVIGFFETVLALGLIISMKWTWMLFFPLVGLWVFMAGAVYTHFKAGKIRTSVPAFFLLTLISIALVLNK
ncbi:MAG: DoxX family protein [Candidatus Planktophila sp.]